MVLQNVVAKAVADTKTEAGDAVAVAGCRKVVKAM